MVCVVLEKLPFNHRFSQSDEDVSLPSPFQVGLSTDLVLVEIMHSIGCSVFAKEL